MALQKTFSIVLLLLLGQSMFGQEAISLDDYFNVLKSSNENRIRTTADIASLPTWIDDIEFRTQTDEFDFERQRYVLRVSPINKDRRIAEYQILRAMKEEASLQYDDIFEAELKLAYTSAISMAFMNAHNQYQNELEKVLLDQITVMEKLTVLPNFKYEDLLDATNTKNKILLEKSILQAQIANINYQLASVSQDPNSSGLGGTKKTFDFETNELINIDQIEMFVASVSEDALVLRNPIVRATQLDQEILRREREAELAEDAQILDFVQVEYRGPNYLERADKWRFGAGIRFPVNKEKNFNVQKIKLENDLENLDLEIEQRVLRHEIRSDRSDLLQLIADYRRYEEFVENELIDHKRITERYLTKEGTSPLLLLKIKEQEIENKIVLLEKQEEIYAAYIDFLEDSGMMMFKPFKNYISSNFSF